MSLRVKMELDGYISSKYKISSNKLQSETDNYLIKNAELRKGLFATKVTHRLIQIWKQPNTELA